MSEKSDEYARKVVDARSQARGCASTSTSAPTSSARRSATRASPRYPYLLVVGPKEAEAGAVGVRSRDAGELGAIPLEEFAAKLVEEAKAPG